MASKIPSSTSLLRRSVRTLREMPRLSWNSSNRRSPRKASRMIRRVHRSPTSSRARAIEQFCPWYSRFSTLVTLPDGWRERTHPRSGVVASAVGSNSVAGHLREPDDVFGMRDHGDMAGWHVDRRCPHSLGEHLLSRWWDGLVLSRDQ